MRQTGLKKWCWRKCDLWLLCLYSLCMHYNEELVWLSEWRDLSAGTEPEHWTCSMRKIRQDGTSSRVRNSKHPAACTTSGRAPAAARLMLNLLNVKTSLLLPAGRSSWGCSRQTDTFRCRTESGQDGAETLTPSWRMQNVNSALFMFILQIK